MGKIYINCSRCGKDLECEELCDVYTSKIDDSFICKDCYKKEKPDYIQQLKQQLDEKDKEIESLTNRTNRYENMFRSRISRTGDMQKDIELYINQLAIQELEKVKINLKDKITMMSNEEHSYLQKVVIWYDICNQVNKQINDLRGEKDVKD